MIYYTRSLPLRASQRDYLFAFKNYSLNHKCYYVNLFSKAYPSSYKKIKFDLVIFTWSYLASRFMREEYLENLKYLDFIKNLSCPKVVMPQDEFSHSDLLNYTINYFNINNVFSVSPSSEWSKIYSRVDIKSIHFKQLLTGYIEDSLIKKIEKLKKRYKSELHSIDIGYRSGAAAYWGRFNLIKFELAEKFIEYAKKNNISYDIKFGWENFLIGNDWYRFLLKCRFIPGVEGGSSIIDWDGSIVSAVQKFVKDNPDANYDEVELNCIPKGKDGEIHVVALSPRHLEACLTKTCQILIKGSYNGVLIPGKHFIELEPDFSNMKDVLMKMNDEALRKSIVEQAYSDIVLSNKYSYRTMTNELFTFFGLQQNDSTEKNNFLYNVHRLADSFNTYFVYIYSFFRNIRNYLFK